LVGIKIALAHDASGSDNISVYIGQTIPEAKMLKRLILGGPVVMPLNHLQAAILLTWLVKTLLHTLFVCCCCCYAEKWTIKII